MRIDGSPPARIERPKRSNLASRVIRIASLDSSFVAERAAELKFSVEFEKEIMHSILQSG